MCPLGPPRAGGRRPAWPAAAAGVVLGLAALALLPRTSAATPVAVVLVAETGNALLPPAAEPVPPARAAWSRGREPRFALPSGQSPPGGPHPLLVIHRLEHLDRILAERYLASRLGRARLRLDDPFRVPGLAARDGRVLPVGDVALDAARLFAGPLYLRRRGADVELRYGDARVRLAAGRGWGEARVRRHPGGPVERVPDDPAWPRRVEGALAEGALVAVLRVAHLGLWPRAAFSPGGGAP